MSYDNGSGIAIEVVPPCPRKSESVRYYGSSLLERRTYVRTGKTELIR